MNYYPTKHYQANTCNWAVDQITQHRRERLNKYIEVTGKKRLEALQKLLQHYPGDIDKHVSDVIGADHEEHLEFMNQFLQMSLKTT